MQHNTEHNTAACIPQF